MALKCPLLINLASQDIVYIQFVSCGFSTFFDKYRSFGYNHVCFLFKIYRKESFTLLSW